ncbi:hypothetical protein GGP41_007855 [Bipolaris sorokiniana]|uniref:BHLH domain-containing protein n=1 Tax=Cochliobolus sativus TaxID=45130 RepID=A0A8H6DYI8_COCSA|nr:hypothetical protein GGP41_007855 [Bipolaris sorokiniana]
MNNSNFYAAQSTFETTLSDKWCSEQPSSSYLVDAYTSQLDEFPWALSDTFVGQAIARYDLPNDFLHRSSEVSTTAFATAVNMDANSTQILSPDCVSRRQATPKSPSCNDMSLDGPSCAPKCESSSRISADAGAAPKRQMGKPGPPKPDPIARSASGASTEGQHTTRIPHNMVERKYRDGLNAQLERLRRAVPALLQSDDGDGTSQPRPSKSMVIAAAINYIETVTLERDMLQAENNKIGSSKGRRGSKRRRVNPASGSTVS